LNRLLIFTGGPDTEEEQQERMRLSGDLP